MPAVTERRGQGTPHSLLGYPTWYTQQNQTPCLRHSIRWDPTSWLVFWWLLLCQWNCLVQKTMSWPRHFFFHFLNLESSILFHRMSYSGEESLMLRGSHRKSHCLEEKTMQKDKESWTQPWLITCSLRPEMMMIDLEPLHTLLPRAHSDETTNAFC